MMMILLSYSGLHFAKAKCNTDTLYRPTLCEITSRADWNIDVVERGSVGRRKIRVSTFTLFDNVALVTCLLARL